MRVADIMSRDVTVVQRDQHVSDAAELMEEQHVGVLPVTEDAGRLVGMITDRDIAIRSDSYGKDPLVAKVADIMTGRVVFCYDDTSLEEAAATMAGENIRRLPVLRRRDDLLIGIVSVDDIVDKVTDKDLLAKVVEVLKPIAV